MHKCLICNNVKFNQILNLRKQPLANSLRKEKKIKQIKYPLNLVQCKKCTTVQLDHVVNPKKLFENYVWTTNSSVSVNIYAKYFFNKFNKLLKKKSKILEIASNDGTFLKYFYKKGHTVIGVDPAKNIAKIANKQKIKTLPEFFNYSTSMKIKKDNGKFDFVFARNVFETDSATFSIIIEQYLPDNSATFAVYTTFISVFFILSCCIVALCLQICIKDKWGHT